MPDNQCNELKQELESIKSLKLNFDNELQNAFSSGDTTKAQVLRKELEKSMKSIQEKLWPFEHLEKETLEQQYNEQRETMARVGILIELSTGEQGILGIDNKEYPFPTFEDILANMKEKKKF